MSPRRHPARVGACAAIVAALSAPSSRAAEPELARAADIACRGALCDTPALRSVIAEVLAGEGVALSWSVTDRARPTDLLRPAETTDRGPAPVRALIDLSRPARARVALVAPGGERFVVREVPLPQGLDEVGRETLAYLLRSAVRLLVDEQQEALSRAEAEAALRSQEADAPEARAAQAPIAVPAPPAPARRGLEASLAWTVRALDDGPHLAHGPRVAIAVLGERLLAALELVALQASTWETTPVGAGLRSFGARAAAGGEARVGAWSWRALVNAGADLTRVEPRAAAASVAAVELAPATSRVEPVAGLSLSATVSVTAKLGLFLAAGLEARSPRRRLELERAAAREVVVRTWPIEPWLGGGLAWR